MEMFQMPKSPWLLLHLNATKGSDQSVRTRGVIIEQNSCGA